MARLHLVAPYVSGKFYKRELPCLLAVLAQVDASLETAVTGVAKTVYRGARRRSKYNATSLGDFTLLWLTEHVNSSAKYYLR
jgi:deoxyinosine 3'endonuclease (endonuclease V)